MQEGLLSLNGHDTRFYQCNTAIVGTGAAGYNAADRLFNLGQKDIIIVTEDRTSGTSRNTGSDKQTYYKLTLCQDEPDSVGQMARTLFDGEAVDGDLALCEAALSAQCFYRLVELGVPFPRNKYGEYIGYKTDHDPMCRATSVGPYTSREMTNVLEKAVFSDSVPMLDHMQVIQILSDGKKCCGLLCLDKEAQTLDNAFVLIACKNIIYAVGGPAGMYEDSVYPVSQHGASGIAFESGVKGKNLTEWQYGLASVSPRWNVSGTYMQVLPRVFSTSPDGSDEREFLMDFFDDPLEMLNRLFLKGYQWPFDVRKVNGGSSIIDILVYLEKEKGRRVWLDYRTDPVNGGFRFKDLSDEAYTYLERAGACFGTPYERLCVMNRPAVDFYRERGVDLETEPLEISLCAQHSNGGLSIDCWWQTNIEGFFAVGEAACSHGVYRPGGSALNAGQVGSTRAAQYIAARRTGMANLEEFSALAAESLLKMRIFAEKCFSNESNVSDCALNARIRMSRDGAAIRERSRITQALSEAVKDLENFTCNVHIRDITELPDLFALRDTLLSQIIYLYAMKDYLEQGGKSRGSALYTDPSGSKPDPKLSERFKFCLDDGSRKDVVQETEIKDGKVCVTWRKVRPIPEEDNFFENVWRSYRETGNFD